MHFRDVFDICAERRPDVLISILQSMPMIGDALEAVCLQQLAAGQFDRARTLVWRRCAMDPAFMEQLQTHVVEMIVPRLESTDEHSADETTAPDANGDKTPADAAEAEQQQPEQHGQGASSETDSADDRSD